MNPVCEESPALRRAARVVERGTQVGLCVGRGTRRQNLPIRMAIRRFTNAFSKKLDNHKAACALHFAYYNFCRIHRRLRVTQAMEAGITDHIWTIQELLA